MKHRPSTAGVATSALLAELAISVWTGRKLDKSASQDIVRINSADRGVANVHKKLLGDCEELEAVRKFASVVRTTHYSITMPWSDSGLRLLPTANYFKYQEAMTGYAAEFDRLVQIFLDAYEWETSQAQVKLGALFNPDDYPTVAALRHKFGMNVSYIPLPTSGDWRVDIEEQAKDELEAHYQRYYEEQIGKAMGDVWSRTKDVLERLSDRLADEADGKPKVFRSTLVDSAMEIVDLLDTCNLTGDRTMAHVAEQLRDTLHGIGADDLRQDRALRRSTKRNVDELIQALPGLGM